MRIAILIHSLDGGGAERVSVALAAGWAERRYKVCIFTVTGERRVAYLIDPRVEVRHLDVDADPRQSPWAKVAGIFNRVSTIRKALRAFSPDVALGMMSSSAVLLAVSTVGLEFRKLGCERNFPGADSIGRAWSFARRWTYGLLDVVTAQTEEASAWVRENTNAKAVVTIPNAARWPVVDEPPCLEPDDVIGANTKVLLAVGRLSEQKGFDLLIEAFAECAAQLPEWQLVILGEGQARPELESRISRLSLVGRIHLPGRAGNVATWYGRADAFVLSSRFEGFPNVLVEAMSFGLPVVSTNCPQGPSAIIEDRRNGLLASVGVPSISSCIRELMTNASLRAELGANASDVRFKYSEAEVLLQWEEAIRSS